MIVVGLISGTSMDGIDAATADLQLAGDVITMRPLGHETVPYSDELRARLHRTLPPHRTRLKTVCRLDTEIGQEFAAVAASAAERFGADLVVSHGQTVFHWVKGGKVCGTLQIGQPAWIAERTGLPVVSDLRTADIAAGGQGAPLVSLFDVLLLGRTHHTRAALNLGGIANLTVLPGNSSDTEPFAYDAGPANALIDAAVSWVTNGSEHHDQGGKRAAKGTVVDDLLADLLAEPYYERTPPKTTGKELFNLSYLADRVTKDGEGLWGKRNEDLVATVTAHAAAVVAAECERFGLAEVVASGGGVRNPALMRAIAERATATRLSTIDEYGVPSDAKEAYAFAVLGFLTAQGLPGTVPSCTGAHHATVLGRITPGRRPPPAPEATPKTPTRLEVITADPI